MPRTCSREFVSLLLVAASVGAVASHVQAGRDAPPPFVGTTVSQDALLETLATSPSRQFKPVGRNSILFRMRTASHVTAAYKVKSRRSEHGYRAEIAAYRLSRLLHLDNVPPAIFRRATRTEIERRFHEDKLESWPAVRRQTSWDDDGSVVGAALFWIKRPRRGLGRYDEVWRSWLRADEEIPDDKLALARDLSNMVVFDFLVANWDRHSGGNLLMTRDRSRAILIDNDRAFSGIGETLYVRLLDDLLQTERFSQEVVDRLLRLDRASILEELAKDPSHEPQPLLTHAQIDALLDRRATILSHIAALVEQRGRAQVLFFP